MPIASGIQPNIFRAVSGSLFSSPVNWSRGVVPTGSDVAMIADNCVIDINRTIGSLVVRAPFTASINTGLTLNISQSINVLGHLSCSGTPTINVLGPKNIINSLSPASSSFFYLGSNQTIPGVTYWTLSIRNPGIKKSNSTNTTVLNLLSVREYATYDIANSNLTVSGTSRIGENAINGGTLLKTGIGGSVLFIGRADFDNATSIFSGNPRVEMRNGFTIANLNNSVSFGNNDLYFTTNNQSIYESSNFFSFSTELFNNMFISGGITLTLDYISTILRINKPINGLSADDKLINKGALYFMSADSVNTMMTGGFDYSTFNNSIGYTGNYSRTMLPYSSSYRNLRITGTGVKTLPSNTSVSGSIFLGAQGTLDMGNFDLIVSGTATIGENAISPGYLQKSTPGSIIFIGRPYFFYGFITLTNNPTVEFRNGIDANYTNVTLNSNNIRFTTNNQSLVSTTGYYNNVIISGSALISGGINLTLTNNTYYFDGPINGFSASDTLVNSGSIFFASAAAFTGSLITGSANFSFPGNTINFGGNYSGTSSVALSNFHGLSISGTGVKTLGTSSYISGGLSIANNGYLNMSSSNLTVNGTLTTGLSTAVMSLGTGNLYVSGTSTVWQFSKIITSASNNIIFNGLLDFRDYGVAETLLDFSLGSPNVEIRNGIYTNQGTNPNTMRSGFGTWSFTTNNQALTGQYAGTSNLTFTGSIIVSGAITLSNRARTNIYQPLRGTDPNSKFENFTNSILGVYTTSSLMTTGIIDIKTYPNTVLYAMEGNYVIPYQSYRNLQIDGGATKSINQNTDLTGSLYVGSNLAYSNFELSSSNLFVSGAASIINARLSKSGSGNIIFNDLVTFWDYGTPYIIDFSLGNPNVEFRNGLYATNQGSILGAINSGTGSWTFSTNSQTLTGAATNLGVTIKAPITISGPITFTVNLSPTISGSLNGDNANSKLLMATNSTIYYANSATPMSTGILDATSSLSTTFIYASGSQNVRGGVYRNLTFLNGLKTLQGNVSVLGTFSTGSGATSGSFNLNGFTLTNP